MAYNPYIVVPLATWAVTQVSKFAIAALRGRLDLRYLYASGGMPSVHSAVVCSLATTALLVDGIGSHLFGFTAIFAAIVMYDSFGVRRSTGEQAAAINMLIMSLDEGRIKLDQPKLHLREILGHQPKEVTVGAIVGVVLACLFNYDRIGPLTNFLQGAPAGAELWIYVAVFALLVIGGIIQRIVLPGRFAGSKVVRQLARRILTATQTIGWLGLLTTVFQYEHASYAAWRFWSLLVLAAGVIWAVSLVSVSYHAVPAGLAAEATTTRKLKWLTVGRKRSKKRA